MMKAVFNFFRLTLALVALSMFASLVAAQTENPKTQERVGPAEVKTEKTDAAKEKNDKPEPVVTPTPPVEDVKPPEDVENVLPYYNNYLKEYRLGPNDVISVEVFGQCPDYCKTGITVPPTARISYPLIREGVLVGGKTVEQIADEITKKLDEYIIDPKVTVTLDKAMSVRYSVMGKVATPGIRIMDRKVSLYEALIEAGGLTKDGDRKKVAIISIDGQGKLARRDVNLTEMESGKTPMIYLNPGDQVVVGGKGFTIDKFLDAVGRFSALRLIFGGGF